MSGGENVTFTPTEIDVTMTCNGVTETKPLGSTFSFNAPTSGSGKLAVNASYTLIGNVECSEGIVVSGGFSLNPLDIELLAGAEFNLGKIFIPEDDTLKSKLIPL